MAEWLRRWTANPMGSARVSSNLILVETFYPPVGSLKQKSSKETTGQDIKFYIQYVASASTHIRGVCWETKETLVSGNFLP